MIDDDDFECVRGGDREYWFLKSDLAALRADPQSRRLRRLAAEYLQRQSDVASD